MPRGHPCADKIENKAAARSLVERSEWRESSSKFPGRSSFNFLFTLSNWKLLLKYTPLRGWQMALLSYLLFVQSWFSFTSCTQELCVAAERTLSLRHYAEQITLEDERPSLNCNLFFRDIDFKTLKMTSTHFTFSAPYVIQYFFLLKCGS